MNTTGKCKRYKNKNKPHHWMVDAPEGTHSEGTCKHCKVKQTFKNSIDYTHWSNWSSIRNEKSSKPKDKKLSLSKSKAV